METLGERSQLEQRAPFACIHYYPTRLQNQIVSYKKKGVISQYSFFLGGGVLNQQMLETYFSLHTPVSLQISVISAYFFH